MSALLHACEEMRDAGQLPKGEGVAGKRVNQPDARARGDSSEFEGSRLYKLANRFAYGFVLVDGRAVPLDNAITLASTPRRLTECPQCKAPDSVVMDWRGDGPALREPASRKELPIDHTQRMSPRWKCSAIGCGWVEKESS